MPAEITGNYTPQATTEVFVTDASKFNPDIQSVLAANAASQGLTAQQYILSRGGVNPVTGKYGDSYNPQLDLTDAEYKAAVAGKTGVAQGEALNAAQQAKQQAFYASSGTGYKAPDGTYYASRLEAAQAGALVTTGGAGGSSGASGSAGGVGSSGATSGSINAIAAISALLSSYGIGDLSAAITEAVQKGYTSDTIQLIMQDPNSKDPLAVAFQTRFPANKTRLATGKSVLSAAEYLAAERTYTQVMQSYGVANIATKDTLNSFISNDISAAEVADRVDLAVNRVKNADPFTKAALAQYYPSLNQSDIVGALLNPAEGLPALKRKVTIAEIGGAAAVQGLQTGLATANEQSNMFTNVQSGALGAEGLAAFGITQDQARKGYETVAGIAPRAEFLSSITASDNQYTRLQAEQEAFLGTASAKRAREALTAEEQGRFQGSSGASKGAFSTQYLNRGSSSGQF
jgi:hypothetical protein